MNIFNESPLRIKMSFTSSGYYSFKPNCVYKKDGYFCFEINDEHYRMVYHVKVENDKRVGYYYTQFGKTTEVSYTPIDEPYKYVPTEIFVTGTDKSRLSILKQHAEYEEVVNMVVKVNLSSEGIFPKYLKNMIIPLISAI